MPNCFIESFNGGFRDECLNGHWFTSIDDAKTIIGALRNDYNDVREHSSLGGLTPAEYRRALESPENAARFRPFYSTHYSTRHTSSGVRSARTSRTICC